MQRSKRHLYIDMKNAGKSICKAKEKHTQRESKTHTSRHASNASMQYNATEEERMKKEGMGWRRPPRVSVRTYQAHYPGSLHAVFGRFTGVLTVDVHNMFTIPT